MGLSSLTAFEVGVWMENYIPQKIVDVIVINLYMSVNLYQEKGPKKEQQRLRS